jgi:hypothetical protein
MKRKIELQLAIIGIVILAIAIYFCFRPSNKPEDVIKILTFTAALIFFAYKLLVGWLFINLNLKVEPERINMDAQMDHFVIKLTLAKGSIDSLWLEDVQLRFSEMTETDNGFTPVHISKIKPLGLQKRDFPPNGKNDISALWEGEKLNYYVLSPKEEATFSTYTTVKKGKVILVEVIVLGTRPFYGMEYKSRKPIQWRSSVIVLPVKEM